MTDTELYQIVKDHREAWPELVTSNIIEDEVYWWICDTLTNAYVETMVMLFEASFHRAIQKHTYSVLTEISKESARVTVQHHTFEAPSLIEAYAKALEWLK